MSRKSNLARPRTARTGNKIAVDRQTISLIGATDFSRVITRHTEIDRRGAVENLRIDVYHTGDLRGVGCHAFARGRRKNDTVDRLLKVMRRQAIEEMPNPAPHLNDVTKGSQLPDRGPVAFCIFVSPICRRRNEAEKNEKPVLTVGVQCLSVCESIYERTAARKKPSFPEWEKSFDFKAFKRTFFCGNISHSFAFC